MDYVRPLTKFQYRIRHNLNHLKLFLSMLDVCLTLDPGFSTLEDLAFLDAAQCVYLLGSEYSAKDVEGIKEFSKSILWFTYRKSWPAPIGGFGGPTSDRGWGCMIRCGQMLLAQAISTIHLGRDWRWNKSNAQSSDSPASEQFQAYQRLLKMFQDKRTALFSIHQIAQFGVSEGKQLGEWLGPNTMAQVLKKLILYDEWTRLVVHVAMDNVLISDDVRIMASQPVKKNIDMASESGEENSDGWKRPLLLMVPLRLGLTAINPCYLNAVIEYFKLSQCVGILGGRPNHAVYFYGSAGKRLLYLDPHICQEFRDLDTPPPPPPDSYYDAPIPHHHHQPGSSTSNTDTGTGGGFSSSDPELLGQPDGEGMLRSATISPPSESGRGDEDEAEELPPAIPSSSSSSSNSDRGQQNPEAAISFPTSSSMSKVSSSGGTTATNTPASEPEVVEECQQKSSSATMYPAAFDSSFITASFDTLTSFQHPPSSISSKNEEEEEEQRRWMDGMTPKKEEGDEGKNNGNGSRNGDEEEAVLLTEDPAEDEEEATSSTAMNSAFDDTSFHCPYLLTMDFKSLDPSLALGFLVRTAADYEELVHRLKTSVLPASNPPLFEVLDSRPRGWPRFTPFESPWPQDDEALNIKEYDDLQYDSDEQFELLE